MFGLLQILLVDLGTEWLAEQGFVIDVDELVGPVYDPTGEFE